MLGFVEEISSVRGGLCQVRFVEDLQKLEMRIGVVDEMGVE